MSKNLIKLIVSSVLLIFFIGMCVLFSLKNVNVAGSLEFLSIQGLIARKDDVLKKEQELTAQQKEYTQTLGKLTEAQNTFDKEKNKYEAISDETIEIIKEATTQDNYNMEYMWIKLGNYAKKNNLSLIVIEPGADDSAISKDATTNNSKSTTTTTNTTTNSTDANKASSNSSSTNNTSNSNNSSTQSTSGTKTTSSSTSNQATTNSNQTTSNQTTSNGSTDLTNGTDSSLQVEDSTKDDSTMKIQLQGSYIDISDFIFEVENDDELKFKLDNIRIEYVEGTTIKATFDVKNTIIVK